MAENGQKKGAGKHVAIAVVIVVVLLAAVYVGMAIYFQNHFVFNSTLDGISIERKTPEEVEDLISREISKYTLRITGREGTDETIAGSSIGIEPLFQGEIEEMLSEQNAFAWIVSLFRETTFSLEKVVTYDADALEEEVLGLSCMKEQRKPVNAAYSEYRSGEGYALIPADYGTTLDEKAVLAAAGAAVLELDDILDLEESGCYVEPEIGDDNAVLLGCLEQLNRYAGVTITYDLIEKEEVLDGETIHTWLSVDDDMQVAVDEDAVYAFVKELSSEYNTAYSPKTLKTSYGSVVTITGGSYGWWIDKTGETEQILADLEAGEDVKREPVYTLRANSHGENDYGDSYVEINLTAQHLFLYKDGKLILESDFVSGTVSNGHATPSGAFPVTYTTTNAILRGDNYATPVSYWMPFNGDIGMHDAVWRGAFGSNIYKTNGSHGCINLPLSAAQKIYETIEAGYAVLVYTLPGTQGEQIRQQDLEMVIGKIDAIGDVTLGSGDAIAAARYLYDALDDVTKPGVTNYDALVNAENVYAGLQAAAAQSPTDGTQGGQ